MQRVFNITRSNLGKSWQKEMIPGGISIRMQPFSSTFAAKLPQKRKAAPDGPYNFPKPPRPVPPLGHRIVKASKSKPLPSWSVPTPEQMALAELVSSESYQASAETRHGLDNLRGQSLYAIVEIKGIHYHVATGDVVVTPRMPEVDLGSVLRLDRVREIGSKDVVIQGSPFVHSKYHKVELVCLEHATSNPVAIQKKRRRGHRPVIIHRDYKTLFRVSTIEVI
jgi:ribosomal protein L21